jgi:hypothetical protein
MTRNWTGLVAALLLGTAAACGGNDDKPQAPTQASCNVASGNLCVDLTGVLPTDQADCTSLGGVWSTTAACPTANLVGTCTVTYPGQTAAFRFYPGPPANWDDTNAQTFCTSNGGTYTP